MKDYGNEINMELLGNGNMEIYINYDIYDSIKILNNRLLFSEIISEETSQLNCDYFELSEEEKEELEYESCFVEYYINVSDIKQINILRYRRIYIQLKNGNKLSIAPTNEYSTDYLFECHNYIEYFKYNEGEANEPSSTIK